MNTSTLRKLATMAALLLTVTSAALAQVSVSSNNGQVSVSYKGKQVWSGQAKGTPVRRSSNINGEDYAAAFDGDKVLWENVAGAGAKLSSGSAGSGGIDLQKFTEEHQKSVEVQRRFMEEQQRKFQEQTSKSPFQNRSIGGGTGSKRGGSSGGFGGGSSGGSSSGGTGAGNVTMSAGPDTSVKRINGTTTLTWKGKTIDLGKTSGRLSFKSTNVNGAESLTVLEDDQVLWQSDSGPVKQSK